MTKLSKEDWEDFLVECRSCDRCELAQSASQKVIWRGSCHDPKILIIGEGPGREEDKQGIPFVGRSGKLLDLLLLAQGFREDDVHIMNVVKCRPPGNRAPTPEEAEACKPLALKQLALINPRVAILCGATAFRYYTGSKEPISRARGVFRDVNGILTMPTFHPAYILRNATKKLEFWNDFAAVARKVAELEEHFKTEPEFLKEKRLQAEEVKRAALFKAAAEAEAALK